MNPDFMKEIEKSDKLATLVREFPGKNCGNTECNELCAEALKIAKQLNANPKQLIDEIIQNDIAPKYENADPLVEITGTYAVSDIQ